MPGTPAPAAAAPVPGTASRAGEGDGGDTVLWEATIRAGGGEVPEPERRMPGDGVRALASPVPQAGFGKKWAWQSRGTGALPQEERCWVRRGGPGRVRRKGAGQSLASSSQRRENPALCQPLPQRREETPPEGPGFAKPDLQTPLQ